MATIDRLNNTTTSWIQVAWTDIQYCCRFRKKSGGLVDTLGKMVGRQDYNSYTEMEMHAELVYAECLLLKAMLTVCEDETLVSFVKAGLKVRQCYISFR